MIGTSYEMLYYFTCHEFARQKLGMSKSQIIDIRRKIKGHVCISEERMADMLTELGCVQLRPRYIMPAVFSMRGHIYDERTIFKRNYAHFCGDMDLRPALKRIAKGQLPTEQQTKEIVQRLMLKTITKRFELPSIWFYGNDYDIKPTSDSVGKCIGDEWR